MKLNNKSIRKAYTVKYFATKHFDIKELGIYKKKSAH